MKYFKVLFHVSDILSRVQYICYQFFTFLTTKIPTTVFSFPIFFSIFLWETNRNATSATPP